MRLAGQVYAELAVDIRVNLGEYNLLAASPQGIAALAAQGGVATLTERSDATFSVMQFSSADGE